MIESDDGGCGATDRGHAGVGADVIASVGAPLSIEFAEHVLNPVALAIEHFVTRDWDVAVRF